MPVVPHHAPSGTTTSPAVTPWRPLVPRPCSPKQFSCDTGECVHKDRRCDLQRDCIDGSDEKDCGRCYIGSSKVVMWSGLVYFLSFTLLSRSGLHNVPMDSLEWLQCNVWSRLLVSAEGHSKRRPAWRVLWWSSV